MYFFSACSFCLLPQKITALMLLHLDCSWISDWDVWRRKIWSISRREINYSNKLFSSRYACLASAQIFFFSETVSENKRNAITSNKKNINEWKLRLMNRVIKIAGRRWDEIDSKENGSFLPTLILSFNFPPFCDCLTSNRGQEKKSVVWCT